MKCRKKESDIVVYLFSTIVKHTPKHFCIFCVLAVVKLVFSLQVIQVGQFVMGRLAEMKYLFSPDHGCWSADLCFIQPKSLEADMTKISHMGKS